MTESTTIDEAVANRPLLTEVVRLLGASRAAFGQERVFVRAGGLVFGQLLSLGRRTSTESLATLGLIEDDWSAFYRLFEVPRVEVEALRRGLLRVTVADTPVESSYSVVVDAVRLLRHSRTMPGTSWDRHPQTAAWKRGIARSQRFIDVAWLTPATEAGDRRAISLWWEPALPEQAVRPEGLAAKKEWEAGLEALVWLRAELNAVGRQEQRLLAIGDGSSDTKGRWAALPARTTLLARTARNRALYELPGPEPKRPGRQRISGAKARKPAEWLQVRNGWRETALVVRGRTIPVTYRVAGPYLVRGAPEQPVYLLVTKGIHRRVNGKRRQRDPVYSLVSAVHQDGSWQLPLPAEDLLEWAWQRGEVEVTHRDQKAGFGVGEVQCWGPSSALLAVQFQVWVTSLLMLAGYRTFGLGGGPKPPGRWWPGSRRWSWHRLWQALVRELWDFEEFRRVCPGTLTNWPEKAAWLAAQQNAIQGLQRA